MACGAGRCLRVILPPAAAAVFAAVTVGCRSHRAEAAPVAGRDERRFESYSRLRLRDGFTPAPRVRRAYGPPDYWNNDGTFAAYYTETIGHYVGTPGYQSATDRRFEPYLLLLQFDDQGYLRRHQLHRLRGRATAPEVLGRIADNWKVTGPVRATQPGAVPPPPPGAAAPPQ